MLIPPTTKFSSVESVTNSDLFPASTGGGVGLLLTGGGARAAYQVGVLKAVLSILQQRPQGLSHNPFSIICGTSAGAINACALASGTDNVALALSRMLHVWENFSADQVYRADSIGVMRTGAKWLSMLSFGWFLARLSYQRPRSLFDNSPLRLLLSQMIDFTRIEQNLSQGHLRALAVTASSYTSGQHISFYQSALQIDPWQRTQRISVPAPIGLEHLMASSAIPFIFPPAALTINDCVEWCGDGSMRQIAPISPAIHLGASKVLVIGAGRMHEPAVAPVCTPQHPSLAQIAGHALSNIFLDSLAADVERLQRINHTIDQIPAHLRPHAELRKVDVLTIAPSERIDLIAAQHIKSLPATIRALLRSVGVSEEITDSRGAALASYLLFESSFTQALIQLGEKDTLERQPEVLAFFTDTP